MMPLIGESLDYNFFLFLILFNSSLRPHLNKIFIGFRLSESAMQISVFASVVKNIPNELSSARCSWNWSDHIGHKMVSLALEIP